MRNINSFQSETIEEILRGLSEGRNQVLAWYAGAGKTNVFLEVVARILECEPKAKIGISAFLQRNIKDQTSERAEYFLKDFQTVKRSLTLPMSKDRGFLLHRLL